MTPWLWIGGQSTNKNDYTYPEASVSCDSRDKTTTQYITYPGLIIEVLSDSTEA